MTPAHQDRLLARADRTADAAEAAVGRVWSLILAALEQPGPPAAVAARVAHAARQLPAVGGEVLADLEASAAEAARTTAAAVVATLPARAKARLLTRRRYERPHLAEDAAALPELLDLILPPLLPDQVRRVVMAAGWFDRVASLTRLADPDVLASRVAAAVQAGWSVARIAADIRPAVQHVATSARRVARTAGLWVAHEAELHVYEQGLGDIIAGYTVRAVVDEATRETHRKRNGTRYLRVPGPGEKGFDEMPRPPRESPKDGGGFAFNCLLPDQVVEGAFDLALKSRYTGEVVEVRTRGGRTLTVTPNHPVCTDAGFVAAGQLREGDRLLGYTGDVGRGEVGPDDDEQQPPTRVDQVFRAAEQLGPPDVERGTAFDFHGDGARGDGHVEVISLGRGLRLDIPEHAVADRGGDLVLVAPAVAPGLAPGRCPLGLNLLGIDLAPSGRVGGGRLLRPSGAGDAGPLHPLRIGPAAKIDARRREYPVESGGGLPGVSRVTPTDPEFARELLHRFAGVVAADDVVEVRKLDWSGHVYDLQSPGGWMVANGVFVSNCRCYLDPILSDDAG